MTDPQTQEKIQELQSHEQNLHNIMMQKQTFQVEINETENALTEITNAKDDTYKLIGNIMIKSDKEKIKQELTKKQELISLRLKSIESQEQELTKQVESIRKEVMEKIK